MQEKICPVCKSAALTDFLVRPQVPVCQNLVIGNRQEAINICRADLFLKCCENCGFIFNQAFDLSKVCYGELYDNTQNCSPFFIEYVDKLVNYLLNERNIQNCRIVEVGCGQGAFLYKLVERGINNYGFGFDPSYRGKNTAFNGRVKFYRQYFGSECSKIAADVVVCRHVIEHIADPVGLFAAIKVALKDSKYARVFVETPSLEWILKNQAVWDFFYEHCSYFSEKSLTETLRQAGFTVNQVSNIFNGQYLWLEATVNNCEDISESLHLTYDQSLVSHLVQQFIHAEKGLVDRWKKAIADMSCQSKIALWGAGAKGATFANLVDSDGKYIDCVVDINPTKQGKYLPGTGHLIVDYRELALRGVSVAILMNPNYRAETERLLANAQMNITLIELEQLVVK